MWRSLRVSATLFFVFGFAYFGPISSWYFRTNIFRYLLFLFDFKLSKHFVREPNHLQWLTMKFRFSFTNFIRYKHGIPKLHMAALLLCSFAEQGTLSIYCQSVFLQWNMYFILRAAYAHILSLQVCVFYCVLSAFSLSFFHSIISQEIH